MYPRVAVVFAIMIVATVASSGCLDDSNPLITDIPQMLMDYVNNITKIYVRGFSDCRYSNISIRLTSRVDNSTQFVMDNETYYLGLTTEMINFTMNIVVHKESIKFEYLGNVTVSEVDPIYTVEYHGKIKETTYNWLPFKTAIKEVKDEEDK